MRHEDISKMVMEVIYQDLESYFIDVFRDAAKDCLKKIKNMIDPNFEEIVRYKLYPVLART